MHAAGTQPARSSITSNQRAADVVTGFLLTTFAWRNASIAVHARSTWSRGKFPVPAAGDGHELGHAACLLERVDLADFLCS